MFFLFLRDALSGQIQELTFSEVESAAQAQHIEAIEYTLIGGDNFDLVKINGKMYDQHKTLYGGVVLFESIMRIDQAETLLITVENYGGVTNIIPKSGVTLWTVLLNLVPMILILVVLFIIFRNANSQNSKAFDFAKNRAKLNREKINYI